MILEIVSYTILVIYVTSLLLILFYSLTQLNLLINYLTYKNVNDLMDIVLCFIIIPAIYLIIFRDFRTESFLFAALALILYQFLNYGLAKSEQERKELWGQDKSFI